MNKRDQACVTVLLARTLPLDIARMVVQDASAVDRFREFCANLHRLCVSSSVNQQSQKYEMADVSISNEVIYAKNLIVTVNARESRSVGIA